MISIPFPSAQSTTESGSTTRMPYQGILGGKSLKGDMELSGNYLSKSKGLLKFCFKCGRYFHAEFMKHKFGVKGKRIGDQCLSCHARQSESLINRK